MHSPLLVLEHHYGCSFLFILLTVIPVTIFWFLTWFLTISIPLLFSWTIFFTIKIIAFSYLNCFLPTCIGPVGGSNWFLYGSQQLAPVQVLSLLVLLPISGARRSCSAFCSLLFVAIFTSHVRTACCSAFSAAARAWNQLWCHGLFTTSLIWSVICDVQIMISLMHFALVVVWFRLSPFAGVRLRCVFGPITSCCFSAFSLLFCVLLVRFKVATLWFNNWYLLFLSQLPLLFDGCCFSFSLRQPLCGSHFCYFLFDCFLFRCKAQPVNFQQHRYRLDAWLLTSKPNSFAQWQLHTFLANSFGNFV